MPLFHGMHFPYYSLISFESDFLSSLYYKFNFFDQSSVSYIRNVVSCDKKSVKNCAKFSRLLESFYYNKNLPEIKHILDMFVNFHKLDPSLNVRIYKSSGVSSLGLYSYKRIHINYSEINIYAFSTFIHEISHYVMDKLFCNYTKPYNTNSQELEYKNQR